ncbi:MAG: ribonuclease HI [Oligoflexia bacterium]|nr:ribonuclease HI [Oligoflexia bacterium]
MTQSNPYPITVFADGACSGNPGPGGWGVVIAYPEGQVEEYGGRDPQTTNNRMEMVAVIHALNRIGTRPGPIRICTDSTYVIRGITQWVWGWRNRDWKTAEGKDVNNQDLWQAMLQATGARAKLGPESKIQWKYVRGHSGIPGNERVDEIAVAFSKAVPFQLYRGPLLSYPIAIHDLPEDAELPEMRPKVEKKAAFSYLSLLGSTAMRHRTWASCERRVKGQPGAKFKKAASPEEERSILNSWGVRPEDVRDDISR